MNNELEINNRVFFDDITKLIEKSRQNVVKAVNSELSLLYWNIGKRINEEVLLNERAEYGKQIIKNLSALLITEYGNGWSKRTLDYCTKFAKNIPEQIVHTVCAQFRAKNRLLPQKE